MNANTLKEFDNMTITITAKELREAFCVEDINEAITETAKIIEKIPSKEECAEIFLSSGEVLKNAGVNDFTPYDKILFAVKHSFCAGCLHMAKICFLSALQSHEQIITGTVANTIVDVINRNLQTESCNIDKGLQGGV